MAEKRFVLFLSHPPSSDDVTAGRMLTGAPHAITSQLHVFTVTSETASRVPTAVRAAGTPALLDRSAQTLAPTGRETLTVLHKLLQQAAQLEAAQSAAAARLVSELDSFAPPEPGTSRKPVSGSSSGPGSGSVSVPMPQYHSFHTADRDPRSAETHADPRSMPGSTMPHTSQMNAPLGSARPDVPSSGPTPPGIAQSGVAGSRDGPAPSTLGPNGTIGGGVGTPGGTRGFGRPGFGLGLSIADTMDNSSAGIANTPEASQYAMQVLFGGEQTPYDVEQGRVPPYMTGRNMRGSTLAPDHTFAEGGHVSEEAIRQLDEMRKASDAMLKTHAGSRSGAGGGLAGITPESDKGSGGGGGSGGMRHQSAARLAPPGVGVGAGAGLGLGPVTDTLRSGMAQRKEATSLYSSMGMDSSSLPMTAMPGMASGMTNVAF